MADAKRAAVYHHADRLSGVVRQNPWGDPADVGDGGSAFRTGAG
jgi:hypothetical protein